MFIPDILPMASVNDFTFSSYGLHNLGYTNTLQLTNPLISHGSFSHNFLQPIRNPSLDHQIFRTDMIPQYNSFVGGLGLCYQQTLSPTYCNTVIPIYRNSTVAPVPHDFISNSTHFNVVRHYYNTVIPFYRNSTVAPEPRDLMLSNLTHLNVVRYYYNTYEWDLPSDLDIRNSQQDISTIMNSVKLPIPHTVLMSEKRLCERLEKVNFDSVPYVYNPLVYAFEPHQDYLRKYCYTEKPILFLGMNPGPKGMVQNGVPFGEYKTVKEWLKVEGEIYEPKHTHPKKPVKGWDMTRSEGSGKRLWGLIQRICGEPDIFFINCFVHNYCPLAFFDSDGRNISLSDLDLKDNDRDDFNVICDESLLDILKILNVKLIICIGRFVESSVDRVLKENHLSESIHFEYLRHPSSRNRFNAHENWEANAMQTLIKMKVIKYLKGEKFDKAKWDRERLNPEAQE